MIEDMGRVLVVGGGIGGMAAAIALSLEGVSVDIVEIDPEWKVYGAGITITGPTLRAFRQLGLLDQIAAHGFLMDGAHMHLYDGTFLFAVENAPIEEDLPGAGGILRPVLHRIMSDEIRRLGVTVRLGVGVETFAQDADGVDVIFSDGSKGRYALVVGADGIYSKTRNMVFDQSAKPVYTGQMSWRVVAPRPDYLHSSLVYVGHDHIAGIVPCSDTRVYAFVLHPMLVSRRVPDEDKVSFFKDLCKDFGGEMGHIRDGVTSESSIVQRPFEYALQPLPWHVGRIVLIGDAAHATTAHLASGAGLAVEDAIVLTQELVRAGGNIAEAIPNFEGRRFERCKFVVETSVAIGQSQLDHAPAEETGQRMKVANHRLAEAI